jgi:ABC-type transport system involved in multi-copper enzyme maturation permease subunit
MLFNPVLAGLTVRQALAKRRWMIVLLLAALPVVMATLIHLYGTVDDEPLQIVAIPIMTLIYTVVVPVIALILASSSFGAEIEDGTAITCWPSRSRAPRCPHQLWSRPSSA